VEEGKADCSDAWKSIDLKLAVCIKENRSLHLNLREDEFTLSYRLKE